MFRIVGSGSWQGTKIFKDNKEIQFKECVIVINEFSSGALVDGVTGSIDLIVIEGFHGLVGQGRFQNTKFLQEGTIIRGVQGIVIDIKQGEHTKVSLDMIFLPNLIERTEDGQEENN